MVPSSDLPGALLGTELWLWGGILALTLWIVLSDLPRKPPK
jgi:hypothetical protein